MRGAGLRRGRTWSQEKMSTTIDTLQDRFLAAQTFEEYLERVQENRDLWHSLYQRAKLPVEQIERAAKLEGEWKLLVLLEDWCGDAFNTIPAVARLAEAVPQLELRVLPRDENLDLMDEHLSPTGGRSIPVVMLLDADYVECAWWGSRPAPLQQWIDEHAREMEKEERYKQIRTWYARDRGATAVAEIVALLEQCAAAVAAQ
jgi:hypothetical protein